MLSNNKRYSILDAHQLRYFALLDNFMNRITFLLINFLRNCVFHTQRLASIKLNAALRWLLRGFTAFTPLKSIRFATSLLFIFTASAYAEERWEHQFTREDISVYTRDVEGSPLKAFMAECDLKAPVETVNRLLCDKPPQVKWIPDCIASKVILIKSADEIISYTETSAPVVNNRDVIVETMVIRGKGFIIHEFHALDRPDLVPEYPGKVRIKNMEGMWKITPSINGTHVIFVVRANPGGFIPAWLANFASKDIPYRTLQGLRRVAEEK